VLALILKRTRVRALVRDAKAATAAFGPYVEVRIYQSSTTSCAEGIKYDLIKFGFVSIATILLDADPNISELLARGVHCTKLVRVHVSAQEGY
jgi:hypothetical protein